MDRLRSWVRAMAQPQAEGFRNPRNQNPTEAHDVNFYRICAGNIMAPDPEADRCNGTLSKPSIPPKKWAAS